MEPATSRRKYLYSPETEKKWWKRRKARIQKRRLARRGKIDNRVQIIEEVTEGVCLICKQYVMKVNDPWRVFSDLGIIHERCGNITRGSVD